MLPLHYRIFISCILSNHKNNWINKKPSSSTSSLFYFYYCSSYLIISWCFLTSLLINIDLIVWISKWSLLAIAIDSTSVFFKFSWNIFNWAITKSIIQVGMTLEYTKNTIAHVNVVESKIAATHLWCSISNGYQTWKVIPLWRSHISVFSILALQERCKNYLMEFELKYETKWMKMALRDWCKNDLTEYELKCETKIMNISASTDII